MTGIPQCLSSKESICNTGDAGLIPGSRRSPGGGHSNLLQYSCLENPWTEKPGGYSPWVWEESDMTEWLPHTIYNKRGKYIQWGKESLFNEWYWENWRAKYKRMTPDYFLIPFTKNKLKIDLRLKCKTWKTIKFLEENIGNRLSDISLNYILGYIPSGNGSKSKTSK